MTTRPPTLAALTAEARRVFGRYATVKAYGRPHYLPMVQAGNGPWYIRVSLGPDDTVAQAKARLLTCLKALPTAGKRGAR